LASEHGYFVAQSEDLDLLRIVGARQENDKLEKTVDSEVDEGPQLTLGPCTPHRGEGSPGE
jgi:hypothetical protein